MAKNSPIDSNALQTKVITAPATATWASLKTPKQFPGDDKSNFLITTHFSSVEEAQPIIDLGNGLIEKCCDIMGKRPKMTSHEFYSVEDDGRVIIKWKKPYFKANDRYSETPNISVYMPGENGELVDWDETDWHVGNGSIVRIGGYLRPYFGPQGLGISVRLDGVKLISLEKYVQGQNNDFSELVTAPTPTPAVTTGEDFGSTDF